MFGRVRAPSSSPDSLLRPPSKIPKDDSFSIYETTLIKLKLGSQRSLDDSMDTESNCGEANASAITKPIHEDAMTIDANCSSLTFDSGKSDIVGSEQQWRKNLSVVYMFSRYNNSRNGLASREETMGKADDGSASVSCSSCCSECLCDDSVKKESESPSPVSHFQV